MGKGQGEFSDGIECSKRSAYSSAQRLCQQRIPASTADPNVEGAAQLRKDQLAATHVQRGQLEGRVRFGVGEKIRAGKKITNGCDRTR